MSFNFFTIQYTPLKLEDQLELCFGIRGETRGKKYFRKGRNTLLIPLITNIILPSTSLLLLVHHVPNWLHLYFRGLVHGVPLLRQGHDDIHHVA